MKSKYGFNEKVPQNNLCYHKNETLYKFEDLKDELDQDYVHVPEEHEEDPPLRIRS